MKKAIVLLLALAFVGGAAFAQATVSADATLSWGFDLDTQATGFANDANVDMTFPLFPKATPSVGGDGDVYGYLQVKNLKWVLTESGAGGNTAAFTSTLSGAITAKLVFKPFELTVFGAPDLGINYAAELATGELEFADLGWNGTMISYVTDPLTAGVKIVSNGDWTSNTANDYAFGSDFSFVAVADLLTINGSVAYNLADTTNTFWAGFEAPVTVALMNGLEITPAADFSFGSAVSYDFATAVALYLSEANADDEQTTAALNAYYSSVDAEAELSASFDEYLVGGLVENAEFGAAFTLYDFLAATELPWTVETYAGYDVIIDDNNDLYGRVDFDVDYLNAQNLTLQVVFTNVAIANTTITATYESGNLLAATPVLGTFITAVKIEM